MRPKTVLWVIDKVFVQGLLCPSFRLRKDGNPRWSPTFSFSPLKRSCRSWQSNTGNETGEKEKNLEKAAFEAGEAIRNGDYTLANLEAIVRWKSERAVQYLIGNSSEKIRRVLGVAAAPQSTTEAAVKALLELHGVDISRCLSDPGRNLP